MRLLGLAAIYQRPNTSKPAAAHKIYPYLLRGLAIERLPTCHLDQLGRLHLEDCRQLRDDL
jgi:hypothetical protein